MPFPTEEKAGLHYVDHGGEGDPIVLVHGLGGSHLNWDLIAPGLTEWGRVVAVDLPGFGLNPLESPPDVNSYADLVSWFVDEHFGQPATLIGNSMGGLVSLLTSVRYPRSVARLALISPALPPRVARFYWATGQLLLRTTPGLGEAITERAYERYSMEELTDLAYENICADPSTVPEQVRSKSISLAHWRKDRDYAIRAFSEASASILRIISRPRMYRRLLEAVIQPTLLIHGDADRIVQPAAAVWAAGVRPDWSFHLLPDVGHVPMIERPQAVTRLITSFAERHPLPLSQSSSA